MSVSLLQVIQDGGYDLTTKGDCEWLLSKQREFEELIEEAYDTLEAIEVELEEVEE